MRRHPGSATVNQIRTLVAIPVYNEQKYVRSVLDKVLREVKNVLIVDDGSTDATPRLIAEYPINVVRHSANRGYGRSIRDAFRWARCEEYDWLITMDCDEQHEPASLPVFFEAIAQATALGSADIISGSRYLTPGPADDQPPIERRSINAQITKELNQRFGNILGAPLTDAFCGFKAYRVESLRHLQPTESGYAFPMQLWVQAAAARLKVRELPIRLIYNDPNRSFGEVLDNPDARLKHYRCVLHREILAHAASLPASTLAGLSAAPRPCEEEVR
jgi:glycosyltransferase involved in cell wall biosynthesis